MARFLAHFLTGFTGLALLGACSSPQVQAPPATGTSPSPAATANPPAATEVPPATATPPAGPATAQSPQALLTTAVQAFADGQEEESVSILAAAVALAPAGSPTLEGASYLLGRRMSERGEFAAAKAHLESAASASGPLRPYALLALGNTRSLEGDTPEALAIYRGLAAEEAVSPDVRDAAISAIGRLGGSSDWPSLAEQATGPAALLAAAASLAILGPQDGLAQAVERLVREFPVSGEAIRAIALAEQKQIYLPPEVTGLAYYRNRMLPEAIAVLAPAVDDPDAGASTRAERAYYLAAAIDDSGDPAASVPLYDKVIALFPNGQLAQRAGYWAARALEATGETQSASERYVWLVASDPAGPFAADAAFRAGFAWYEAGQPERAIAMWDLGIAGADARGLYWMARALEETGDTERAAALFASAAQGAISFYGTEAERRMARAPVPFPRYEPLPRRAPPDWPSVEVWLTSHPGLERPTWRTRTAARELAALGLGTDAALAIEAAAIAEPGPTSILELVREAAEANSPHTAATILQRLLTRVPTAYADLPVTLRGILYPLPYADILDQQAKRYGIDPLFLAALVRQESLWDPTALSFAGAIGLTQVMPATGDAIAEALGITEFAPASLRDPRRSLQFGAYYVSLQLAAFSSPAAALAAYNGGPDNARRWATLHDPAVDPAAYLETISFVETHGYVDFVLSGYVRYKELAAD